MRARDQIVFLAIILFIARAVYLSYLQWDMDEILAFLNFDAVIVIAIFMATCAERIVVSRIFCYSRSYGFNLNICLSSAARGIWRQCFEANILKPTDGDRGVSYISEFTLVLLVLFLVLTRWTFGSAKFGNSEGGVTPRRKVSGADLVVIGLVGVLIFGLLAGLVFAGGLLPVINLYVILFALLLILGFIIPFLLAFLGVIDQNIWMRAFREISSRMGLFQVPC